jgi:hypothetical protein
MYRLFLESLIIPLTAMESQQNYCNVSLQFAPVMASTFIPKSFPLGAKARPIYASVFKDTLALSCSCPAWMVRATFIRFDDKALQNALASPWTERLPLVLLSGHELPLDAAYEISVDYVHSLDQIDARAALEG